MSIGDIRNPWVRRAILIVTVPPLAVFLAFLGALQGINYAFGDAVRRARDGWREITEGFANTIRDAWYGE